jgi:hypothetical protein
MNCLASGSTASGKAVVILPKSCTMQIASAGLVLPRTRTSDCRHGQCRPRVIEIRSG